jgi:hypothetical protein
MMSPKDVDQVRELVLAALHTATKARASHPVIDALLDALRMIEDEADAFAQGGVKQGEES